MARRWSPVPCRHVCWFHWTTSAKKRIIGNAGAAARRAARLCLTADRGSLCGARGRSGDIAAEAAAGSGGLCAHRPDRDDIRRKQEDGDEEADAQDTGAAAAEPAEPDAGQD